MRTDSIPEPVLPRTLAVLGDGLAGGWHIGAQLYVSRRGRPIADLALGAARPGLPMTPDTIMPWLSSCKPVGAVAVAQLWERGRLELDDPVCRFVPEFGASGKDRITLRHLLTHTAGIPFVAAKRGEASWNEIIATICAASLEPGWEPGRKAGYHVASAWYMLAEVIRRIDGRPYDQFVRDEIFRPLGLEDSWIGIPQDRLRAYGDRIGVLYGARGAPLPVDLDAEARGLPFRPGGSGRGPIHDLGRFYEMLLFRGTRAGTRILSAQTVEALTARHRAGMIDQTFQHVMDWGLGFILDSKIYNRHEPPYGYGPYASPRTFGHGGYQSSTGYCDPEHGLVVAAVANGLPGEADHDRRFRALNAAIYEDLGLVDPAAGPPTPPADA